LYKTVAKNGQRTFNRLTSLMLPE